jgi:transcriptional regulator with XRE-family HTH domain
MEESKSAIALVFGSRVQQLRVKAGLSQGELAEQAGISQTYLSAIERGDKFPAASNIESLARSLQVPFYSLFVEPGLPLAAKEDVAYGVLELHSALSQTVTKWARENLHMFETPKP